MVLIPNPFNLACIPVVSMCVGDGRLLCSGIVKPSKGGQICYLLFVPYLFVWATGEPKLKSMLTSRTLDFILCTFFSTASMLFYKPFIFKSLLSLHHMFPYMHCKMFLVNPQRESKEVESGVMSQSRVVLFGGSHCLTWALASVGVWKSIFCIWKFSFIRVIGA